MSYGKVNKTTGDRIPYAGNSGGGTSDYTDLTNKPSINSVTLSGNKTASDLSLASTTDLADKQDKFERISYANWQQLTPQQQAAKPYYIYDYPSSAITARNVVYDNTSSGMSADDVQEAVDELKSGLTSMVNKVLFGGYGTYYRTTQASIDGIVDNVVTPKNDDVGYFSADNKASIVGFGNRQFVFGWTNAEKTYAWIVVCSFNDISVGTRANASTFTFTRLNS